MDRVDRAEKCGLEKVEFYLDFATNFLDEFESVICIQFV